jgi:hypothetical protein
MADELARWATERAGDVVARAEAEAVAVLRDALVAAALPRTADAPAAAPATPEAGEVIWTYGVVRAGVQLPEQLTGVAEAPVERIEGAGLVALVTRVPRSEFGAEPLRDNLNDLSWLERVARSHEAVLDRVLATTTLLPLRLCTIYESDDRVRRMLEQEAAAMLELLAALDGRQEWGVKLIVDPDRLARAAASESDQASELERQLDPDASGASYLLRRRLERHVREVADGLASQVAEDVHAQLSDCAIDAVTRPAQNRELSGHEGEMLLNGAYLVEAGRVEELRRRVAQLEERHGHLGARIEVTGPWPPYNFVPGTGVTIG